MKWGWICHTLKKPDDRIENDGIHMELGEEHPRKMWKMTIQEKAVTIRKTWNEVKVLTVDRGG